MKIVLTQDDGSTVEFLDPAGVAAAIAAAPNTAAVTDKEIDVLKSDGTFQIFVPKV